VATQPESAGKEMIFHESYESYREQVKEGNERERDKLKGIATTAWAPGNVEELGLERRRVISQHDILNALRRNSMRLLPHDQDTGGFFVCVLQKAGLATEAPSVPVSPTKIPATPLLDDVTVADDSGSSSLKRTASPSTPAESSGVKKPKQESKKQKRDLGFREDPYSFVDPKHEEVQSITWV